MTTIYSQSANTPTTAPRERVGPQADAAPWAERLAQARPHEIIAAAARALPGHLAVVSSFGTESAVLLKFVADVDPALPVLFLDTLWLFKETIAYRDALIDRLKLRDVRTIAPSPSTLALRDPKKRHGRTNCRRFMAGSAAASAITAACARRCRWSKPMGRASSSIRWHS
jgi:3'-phosphoadenosine 5'-phosphosulfate sulfotransferase (PAPS reductase)/FAD synthetase